MKYKRIQTLFRISEYETYLEQLINVMVVIVRSLCLEKILNLRKLIMHLYMVYYAVKAVVGYGIEILIVLKIFIRYHAII
jgi:hypothetical protein